jgi:hypothetical protein
MFPLAGLYGLSPEIHKKTREVRGGGIMGWFGFLERLSKLRSWDTFDKKNVRQLSTGAFVGLS